MNRRYAHGVHPTSGVAMRARVFYALAITCLGCQSNPSSSPQAPLCTAVTRSGDAQIGVTEDEVQAFLKGMLVTSNVPHSDDPVWPTDSNTTMPSWIAPALKNLASLDTSQEILD